MSVYLITGGSGFIGSNLARELIKKDQKVKIIDNLSTGNIKNLSEILGRVKFIKGDIKNLNLLKKHLKGVDFVIHLAALPSVPRSVKDPKASNNNNINGTLNVLIAAKDSGVKRVIYSSSSSVYGNAKEKRKSEKLTPKPLSPYAVTKLVGEQYCKLFHELYGLETVSLRFFNVFGPSQDPKSQYAAVIPKFITAILKNKRPVIYGDGQQSRDFTYVMNNIKALIKACKAKKAAGKIFNIACGKSFDLNILVKLINKILRKNIKPINTKSRPGDIKHSLADITQAKKYLGYSPKYDFEIGLHKTIEWYKQELKV